MRKLLLGLLFAFAFNAVPVAYAVEALPETSAITEALPEIAAVDDPVIPALDAPATE
jgi:hypothetical protein